MKPFKLHTPAPFIVMAIAAVAVSMTLSLMRTVGPRMLINDTPSEPVGVYRLVSHPPQDYRRGMFVVFPVPEDLRGFVYGRHWLRDGVPLLKELIGLDGDEICLRSDRVEVNGRLLGPVFTVDREGLPLPHHPGCFRVPAGSFFAASHYLDRSFDGRYFGALPLSTLDGEAKPVWTF